MRTKFIKKALSAILTAALAVTSIGIIPGVSAQVPEEAIEVKEVSAPIVEASGDVTINATNFPDTKFKNYVSSNFDTVKDGVLSQTERNNATSVYFAEEEKVRSLQGIEFFPNLTSITCGWNELTKIDVSHNIKLITLKVYGNNLTSIDVSKNIDLETLDIGAARRLENNGSVISLSGKDNHIGSIDISRNTKLKFLKCDYNNITNLDLSHNPLLTKIVCNFNKNLSSLDLSKQTELTELDCSTCALNTLNVSRCSKLVSLKCDENKLTSLNVQHMLDLQELVFGCNCISSIDVSKNTKLTTLDSHNSSFSQENNTISNIDITNNTKLKRIDFYYNKLDSIDVTHQPDLEYLDCCVNRIKSIDLSKNLKLEHLDLDDNNLTKLDVSRNTELKDCEISNYVVNGVSNICYNQISSIDLSKNKKLEIFGCDGNKIQTLDISNNTELGYLCISSNQISSIDLRNNKKLIRLACSGNKIQTLNLSNNPKLKYPEVARNELVCLDLSKNPIALKNWSDYEGQGNTRNIGKGITSFDLSNFTGFDPSKASEWNGAAYNPSNNTISNFTSDKVTYKYNIGEDKYIKFTLILDGNITPSGDDPTPTPDPTPDPTPTPTPTPTPDPTPDPTPTPTPTPTPDPTPTPTPTPDDEEEDDPFRMDGILQLPESKTDEYDFSIDKTTSKLKYRDIVLKKDDNPDTDIVVSGVSDYSKVKWILETTDDYPKESDVARFKNAKGKAASSVTGDSATIIKTKANGKFNSYAVLRLVSSDYKPATKKKAHEGTIYAQKIVFITPVKVSVFKDNSLADVEKNGILFKKDTTDSTGRTYTLTIDEGKSFRIPFKAKDGAEKQLVYNITTSGGFSVVSGTVKGICGGTTGVIKVYPMYGKKGFKPYTINVTVNSSLKSIYANTTAISIAPGDTRVISLGTNPPSSPTRYTYKVSGLGSSYTASITGNLLTITAKTGTALPKLETASVTINGSSVKALNVSVNGLTAPQNITSFTEKNQNKNADGLVEINVPIGGAFNLGVSVQPKGAVPQYEWITGDAYDSSTGFIEQVDIDDKLNISGDVITPLKGGTYYIQAVSTGLNSKGECIYSNIYKINAYTPNSSIVMNDDNYTVQGGFLITRKMNETYGKYEFVAGNSAEFAVPQTLSGDEPIDWVSNKPAGLGITVKNDIMTLNMLQKGTYTVTGTSRYTNQLFTFNVNVIADKSVSCSKFANSKNIYMQNSLDGNDWKSCLGLGINVGEITYIRLMVGDIGAAGTIKFTSSDTKIASVNASGIVTGKTVGKATITATMKFYDKSTLTRTFAVTVNAVKPVITDVSVPEGSLKGVGFKCAVKMTGAKANDCTIKWYFYPTSGKKADAQELTVSNGKASIATAGSYKVFVKINDVESDIYQIDIFDTAPSKINTDNGNNKLKAHVSSLNDKNGVGHGTYIIPIFAFAKNKSDTVSPGLIDWTSDNVYLATAKTVTLADAKAQALKTGEEKFVTDACENAYNIVQIDTTTNYNYIGKVKLTGAFRNSGKKITIMLNIVDGKRRT